MADRIGIALGYPVRDGAVGCDEAVRNAGSNMNTGGRVATGEDVGRVGLEAACAETASRVWRGVKGVKASTTKTASGMKAATVKPASGTKTTATVEAATAPTVETATAAAVETAAATMKTTAAATATARLGYVCEPEPHGCANQDPSERQRNLFAAPSSQHSFLHLSRRRLGRPAMPEAS
ncbi:hypothetical protein [Bradyrhizobium sp. NAS80.1]|uniref:hypothetical protein n=1 Tax=Bradyrhizobium sp. NAS80.1 TaxID=1680159 RepID=UPI000A01F610|nr:hypothetical protein [Bradyrhizobium sp. NAS80.1]